jgi:hypothetical protein
LKGQLIKIAAKAIDATEPEAMELMRQMAHRHFFAQVAEASKVGAD